MTTYTILVIFNDGTNKCIKSFYMENDAIIQFGKIVEEEVKKFDKDIDDYLYQGDTGKIVVYNEYFSRERKIEFFPIAFEIIEQEIDDSIFNWKSPEEQPVKGSSFIAEIDDGRYLFGEILLESGWMSSPHFTPTEKLTPYWNELNNKIKKWFYIKK